MNISEEKLNVFPARKISKLCKTERFYEVPNADGFAFSNYGRLLFASKDTNGKFHQRIQKRVYTRDGESYKIKWNGSDETSTVKILKLMQIVFFPEYKSAFLVNPSFSYNDTFRWNLANIAVLQGKDEIVEYIQSKIEHRDMALPAEKLHHIITKQMCENKDLYNQIAATLYNVRSRATNPNVKERFPQYRGTTICDEWMSNLDSFIEWYLDNYYYYPDALALDKDILGFGETNIYSPEYAAFVPVSINNVFTADNSRSGLGYCIQEKIEKDGGKSYILPATAFRMKGEKGETITYHNYIDALQAGRVRKANYIRNLVAQERAAGYMPEKILTAMEKWANRCELGLVKMWEPSDDTLKRMGVI